MAIQAKWMGIVLTVWMAADQALAGQCWTRGQLGPGQVWAMVSDDGPWVPVTPV